MSEVPKGLAAPTPKQRTEKLGEKPTKPDRFYKALIERNAFSPETAVSCRELHEKADPKHFAQFGLTTTELTKIWGKVNKLLSQEKSPYTVYTAGEYRGYPHDRYRVITGFYLHKDGDPKPSMEDTQALTD